MKIDVAVYGSLAKYAGGHHLAQLEVEFKNDARMADLYQHFGIPQEERGYVFINAILADAPGLLASLEEPLHDGDHVGIFSTTHMWPYQYRDGARMTESLKKALQKHGAMHHSYRNIK